MADDLRDPSKVAKLSDLAPLYACLDSIHQVIFKLTQLTLDRIEGQGSSAALTEEINDLSAQLDKMVATYERALKSFEGRAGPLGAPQRLQ